MSQPESAIRDFLTQHQIRNTTLILGVSGGADSIALLLLLHAVTSEFGLKLLAVHINHHLRHAESDGDQHFVNELCTQLGIQLLIADWQPPADHSGIEEQARDFRYHLFTKTAEDYHASWVFTAHHADDQVETVLHRIIRGSGISGIGGMKETRILSENLQLGRPLLSIRRSQILNFLDSQHQAWREDSSNQDLEFTRNYIRQRLLPDIRERFNPKVDESLLRLASQAREIHSFLSTLAEQGRNQALLADGEILRLDRTLLAKLPAVILRETLLLTWKQRNYPLNSMSQQHWDLIVEMIHAKTSQSRHFPGQIEVITRDKLLLIGKVQVLNNLLTDQH